MQFNVHSIRSLAWALAAALGLALGALPGQAQTSGYVYEPFSGQQGKDVIWVPTPQGLVDHMLDMAKLTPSDYVIDLGSGDGRTVITAAKRGMRSLGVEYNPDMVAYARAAAQREGLSKTAEFVQGDIFQYDFSKATVVTLFLLPELNLRLLPILLSMKAGTRVVSNTFNMGDWQPDEAAEAKGDCTHYCRAMLWVVPAKVDGSWSLPGGRIDLTQTYQELTGTAQVDGANTPVSGRLLAEIVTLQVGGQTYTGRIVDNRMELRGQTGETVVASREYR